MNSKIFDLYFVFLQNHVIFLTYFFFLNMKELDRSLAWRVDIFKWPMLPAIYSFYWYRESKKNNNLINSLNFLNSFDLNIFIRFFCGQRKEKQKQEKELHWWLILNLWLCFIFSRCFFCILILQSDRVMHGAMKCSICSHCTMYKYRLCSMNTLIIYEWGSTQCWQELLIFILLCER